MHRSTALATKPRFNGYSPAQVEAILGEIATSANVLKAVMDDASQPDGNYTCMAAMIAERIGILADLATGGDCVDGAAQWMLGLNFAEEISEVNHG
jgi:hypothetical protein